MEYLLYASTIPKHFIHIISFNLQQPAEALSIIFQFIDEGI